MKRIYIVIEFNGSDAIAQGAFTNEQSAYEAMESWRQWSPTANWAVRSCTLNE